MNINPYELNLNKLTEKDLLEAFYNGKYKSIINISNVNKPVEIDSYMGEDDYTGEDYFVRYVTYPLNNAVEYFDLKMIKYLLNLGANVNKREHVIESNINSVNYTRTPLSKIINDNYLFESKYHIVKLLLERGANPNIKDSEILNTLEIFIKQFNGKDLQSLSLLLNYDAKIPNNYKLIRLINDNSATPKQNIELLSLLGTKFKDSEIQFLNPKLREYYTKTKKVYTNLVRRKITNYTVSELNYAPGGYHPKQVAKTTLMKKKAPVYRRKSEQLRRTIKSSPKKSI